MRRLLWSLWRQDDGQDLIEYTLLLFFIVFITAGVVSIGGESIKGIVSKSNSQISIENQYAGG